MNEGQAMRDIRGDLQDRAALLEEQINAHEAQFDKLIEQLKREHDSRLEDLKTELEAVNRLMELELRRIETVPSSGRGVRPMTRFFSSSYTASPHSGHSPLSIVANSPLPFTSNVTSLIPPRSDSFVFKTSVFQRFDSA